MKKNKINYLYLLFSIVVAILFLCASYVVAYPIFANHFFPLTMIKVLVLEFVVILVTYLILSKLKLSTRRTIIFLILILLIGVGARITSFYIFQTNQISDFANPEKLYKLIAEGNNFKYNINTIDNTNLQNNFALFPTWFIYSNLIATIFNIIGFNPQYIKVINLVLYIFTSLFMFAGVKNMFSKKIALMSTSLFAVSPSLIVYSNIAAPDHFTIMFMSIIIFIWSILLKKINIRKKYILTILLILFMSMVNMFKPLSIYMLLVFICSQILVDIGGNFKNIREYFKKNYKYLLFFIIAFFTINFVVNESMNTFVEKKIKLNVKDSTCMYLLWGYTLDSTKKYNSTYIYSKVMPQLQQKYFNDYDLIMDDLCKIARDTIKDNREYLPYIWSTKFKIAYVSEADYFSFANTNEKNNYSDILYEKYYNKYVLIANSYMIICYMLIVIASILTNIYSNKNKETSILLLMIVGFTFIMVIGGAQARYKSLILLQMFIVSVYGLECLTEFLRMKRKKFKESR